MPDKHLPLPQRRLLRVLRAIFYALLTGGGLGGLLATPRTIVGALGEPLTVWWATLLVVGGTVAIVGLALDRYRVEWLAAWPLLGGFSVYTVSVWSIWIGGETGRATQAAGSAALLMALVIRSAELGGYAKQLRVEHHEELARAEEVAP